MRKRNRTNDQPTGRRARRDRKRASRQQQPGTQRPSSSAPTDLLAGARRAAMWAITLMVTAANAVSFAMSYTGLHSWAERHGFTGWKATAFPLMVDVFIAAGELIVFVLVVEAARARSVEDFRHKVWHRLPGWGLVLLGLAGSVAANVGDVWTDTVTTRVTHAVPPVVATLSLAVALGMLKRIAMAYYRPAPRRAPVTEPFPEPTAMPPLPFHPATRRTVSRPAARAAGNVAAPLPAEDQALLDDAKDVIRLGGTPQARPMSRKHFGTNTRQRRAQTLIDRAAAEVLDEHVGRTSFDAFPAGPAEDAGPAVDENLEPANA